jgi:hypothetical protein
MTRTLLLALIGAVMIFTAVATQAQGRRPRGKRRGPPPQAIEACKGKAEGDTCSFESRRRGPIEGVCKRRRQPDMPLACRPNFRRGRPRAF